MIISETQIELQLTIDTTMIGEEEIHQNQKDNLIDVPMEMIEIPGMKFNHKIQI